MVSLSFFCFHGLKLQLNGVSVAETPFERDFCKQKTAKYRRVKKRISYTNVYSSIACAFGGGGIKKKGKMEKQEYIYRVAFPTPPIDGDPRMTFYFGSLAAIYELFSPQQLGVALRTLWNKKTADGNPYFGEKCVITREELIRKPKSSTNALRSLNSPE